MLGPDGASIAVIDAAMETLVRIDTERMEVTDSVLIHEQTGTVTRALEWLGILPRSVEAKVSEGRTLSATWSEDGRSLFVSGNGIELGETIQDVTGSGTGVVRIDADSGEILGTVLARNDVGSPLISPDGESLYVLVPATPSGEQRGTALDGAVLYRIDPSSLDILAERTFTEWLNVMMLANPAG